MRYHSIAAAALGLLRLGEAGVCNLSSKSVSLETPTYITTAATSTSTSTCKVENNDFANELEGYTTSGNVTWAGDKGYGDDKNGACRLETEGDDDTDDDEGTVEKRQVITGTSVSTTAWGLTAGASFNVNFYYYVLVATPANSCRLRVFVDGVNVASTDRFASGFFNSNWAQVSATATAQSTTANIRVSVNCNARGLARVYIDRISLSRAAVVSSSTDAASSTQSTRASTNAQSATDEISRRTELSIASKPSTIATIATSASSRTAGSSTAVTSGASTTPATTEVSRSVTTNASSLAPSATTTPTRNSTATSSANIGPATVDSTVLIIARDATTAELASAGLLAYGIPYVNLIVPKAGITLPTLNSSRTSGNYGGIIVLDSVSYEYESSVWRSAITTAQWTTIHEYQSNFNVRMVRINDYPGISSGTLPVSGGCCGNGVQQSVFFSNVTDFPTANIKANAQIQTTGLYHVPARITNSSTTRAVAKFGVATGFTEESVAAVINNFGGREQWVWFMSWAPSWSITSSYLQHGHIHWLTRGLFLGKRKVHLGAQIDDVQLSTLPYYPAGQAEVRIDVTDLEAHVDWQMNLAARLPSGSDFWLELAHNGNGGIMNATVGATAGICSPSDAVFYNTPVAAPNEWVKPIGSGVNVWPVAYQRYNWTETCSERDDFTAWFTDPNNLNEFGHISHTFTHLNLNNATYADTAREIQFNQAWMAQVGIDKAERYSGKGLVPPQITGLYNGDALKAWMDNGINNAVGDNTRPQTRNSNNVYWPLITTVAKNGYDGLTIIPRYSTRIYYNCHTAECDLKEWIDTSAGSGDFSTLLGLERESVNRNLLSLQADPYMFHQANMYQRDVATLTIGDQTDQMSLVQAWTETVLQEFIRLTNWPVTSLTQDNLAHYFRDRKTVDECNPKLSYAFSSSSTIKSVTVTANGNSCAKPIPVTIPSGSVSASGGSATSDVVGNEPPIQWVTLSGSPVTLTLSSPVTL